jgi:hypothetical protein
MRSIRLVLVLSLTTGACTLTGTSAMPDYVCTAQDASGATITCSAPIESYPGDGCRCAVPAKGGRGPDMYFGRVVRQQQ